MNRGIVSINPTDGTVLRRFEPHSPAEVDRRLAAAVKAFQDYRHTSVDERARFMLHLAELLERDKAQHARTITLEMGKPLRAAVMEVEKCAFGCRYYAQNAGRFVADEIIETGTARTFVRYQPIGPVLAIMPWNFPFWQLFRFAAPGLMAGNVVLLKHASNVPQCAMAIEELVRQAGFPEGVFQTLLIGSEGVNKILEDDRIRAATLTGSVNAGRSVAAAAGKQIKKTVLELGGSDPFIVMPDANLENAVQTAVQARTINNGQSCIAAKRFIVHRDIAKDFEERFVARMAALRVGDPMDESIDIGPLATEEVRNALQEQVEASVRLGARVLLGGKRLDRPGYFFPPTILAEIPDGAPAQNDELFGPVACVFRAQDRRDAVTIANKSDFGLGSSVWTNNPADQEFFINEIEAGAVSSSTAWSPPTRVYPLEE